MIAGSEFSRKLKKRLVDERIPLENAASDQLRAGIVLAGRGHAPENLFLKNYPNAVALSELNLHDEPGVVKYALWGMAELEIDHSQLRIPVDEIDDCEEQIRKWIFRLIFASDAGLETNLDLVSHIRKDDSEKVREEGAIGLRQNYVEEAVCGIMQWFSGESHEPTRNALIDHFCYNIIRDPRYADLIEQLYTEDQRRGVVRERVEAGVQGTDYYRKFRAIEMREEASAFLPPFEPEGLFGVKKIEQNFNQSTIGGVAGTGGVSVGSQNIDQSGIKADELTKLIGEIIAFAEKLDDPQRSQEGRQLAAKLQKNPSKNIFERAIEWVKLGASGAKAGSELYNAGNGLVEDLSGLAAFM